MRKTLLTGFGEDVKAILSDEAPISINEVHELLDGLDVKTDVTASILQCGLDLTPQEWSFVQTSEI